jgi:hypothetical protein
MKLDQPGSAQQDMLLSHSKVALAALSAGIPAYKDAPTAVAMAEGHGVDPQQAGEASGFQSRPVQRTPHRYRTGRTVRFNTCIMPATFDRFYQIADERSWKIGETVEKALEALEEKLGKN